MIVVFPEVFDGAEVTEFTHIFLPHVGILLFALFVLPENPFCVRVRQKKIKDLSKRGFNKYFLPFCSRWTCPGFDVDVVAMVKLAT